MENLLKFINFTHDKWNLPFVIFFVLLLVIAALAYSNVKARKYFKIAASRKEILQKFDYHLQSITFRGNLDNRNTITYISDNIFTLIGYHSRSIVGQGEISYRSLIHPEDLSLVMNAIHACNTVQMNYQVEYRVRTMWGAEKWVLEQGIVIFDKKDSPKGVEGVLTDITYYKTSEAFLLESEKRFQILIEHAPLGICIFYNDLITFINPVFLKMFGISSPNDVIGTSLLDCLAPQTRDLIKELILKYESGARPRSGYEAAGLRKDGSEFPIEIYLTTVNLGDFQANLAYFIDITDHKRSEEKLVTLNQRLNDIIELIPDPIFVIDKNRKIIHWNKATEELTGVRKEDILGQGDFAYALPFYGKRRPMLLDALDVNDKELEAKYSNVKRVKDKIYGEFEGNVSSKPGLTCLWAVAAPLHDSDGNRFGTIELIKDITEPKMREIALTESERKARILIDSNLDLIILINTQMIIQDCNEGFSQILGKSREELIGTSLELLLPEKYGLYRHSILKKILETGETNTFDYWASDNSRYFTTTICPVKDSNNEIKSIVIYAKDITDLKKAEKALKESEEQYRTITESISDYLYKVIVENGSIRYEFRNPGCERILGYDNSEFEARQNLFYDIILAEDKQLLVSFINLVKEKKISRTFEHRIHHKNGKTVWISNTLIFYKERDENVIEINGVLKDVTFRKHFEHALQEAEERYRSVFDQSGLASNVYDLTGKLIMQNNLAASMCRGTSSDFIGKSIEDIFSNETASVTRQIIDKTLRKGSISDERETTLPSGKYWLKTTSHAIRDDIGNVIGVQLISQDITEKKELDRKILNTIIETEEKERIYFAQELHDGLGPLISAIKMYVQWLSKPNANISLDEIRTDTENLIDDAIQTIREISFKLSPHVLNNFGLIEALKTFAEKIQLTSNVEIKIISNFTERLEVASETILYRILCECVNNTLKHASAAKISIMLVKTETELHINYEDDGIGFDVKTIQNKKKGSGLLNMQSRLQSINGSFNIKSSAGNGTKINIQLKF